MGRETANLAFALILRPLLNPLEEVTLTSASQGTRVEVPSVIGPWFQGCSEKAAFPMVTGWKMQICPLRKKNNVIPNVFSPM